MNLNNASFSCRVYSPLTSISLTGHCFPAQCHDLVFCKVVFPIIPGNDVVFFPMASVWLKLEPALLIWIVWVWLGASGQGGRLRLCLGAAWSCARKFIRNLNTQRYLEMKNLPVPGRESCLPHRALVAAVFGHNRILFPCKSRATERWFLASVCTCRDVDSRACLWRVACGGVWG